MSFWITIIIAMTLANLVTAGIIAVVLWLNKLRKLQLTKIERGNAAFEHLLAAQKTAAPPPPNVIPFPKKVE